MIGHSGGPTQTLLGPFLTLFLTKPAEYEKAPSSPMPGPFPKSFSDEYAKTLVFIHFSASSIFRELPSPSAKIRHRPIVIIILKTGDPARDQGFESLPLRKIGKGISRPIWAGGAFF